jgi:calmodulin-binding transcription activator
VVGYFHEQYRNLTGASLHCVIGDKCVAADTVQSGVYRFVATRHTPGCVNLYLTLDGRTPISEVLSFDYRTMAGSSLESELNSVDDEPNKSKLQMQMRLARLLFHENKKKLAPKFLVEGSKVSNLLSASAEKEWTDLLKFVTDSKGPCVAATEGLLELVLRNRLQEWLVEKIVEGHKSTGRDDLGQGPIHLCSILGYTWAIRLFSLSGFSLDFRDSSGLTALHWAAYYGRYPLFSESLYLLSFDD